MPDEQKKTYHLAFEQRPGYLVARVSGGVNNIEISVAYFSDIIKECKARQARRVLIIEDIKQKPSIIDIYTIVTRWSEIGQGMAGAFVDLHPEHRQNNMFGEHVAVNRGLLGKVFFDIPSAEAWLESQDQS